VLYKIILNSKLGFILEKKFCLKKHSAQNPMFEGLNPASHHLYMKKKIVEKMFFKNHQNIASATLNWILVLPSQYHSDSLYHIGHGNMMT
jgi:hypothetical protein